MTTRSILFTAAGLLVFTMPAVAAPVTAAPAAGWAAWHGCWAPIGDGAPEGRLICVMPGESESSVRIATVQDGAVTEETVLHADGQARPVDEGGCTGRESAFFSQDGRRIFTRAELECEGVTRISNGVIAMVSEVEWVDVQALAVGDQSAARTLRYRSVPRSEAPPAIAAALPTGRDLIQEAARLDASAPLSLAHVIEASNQLGASAVEALLGARQQGFDLDGRRLAMLEEAGVPASTIDVVVALSYPSHFAVHENRAPDAAGRADPRGAVLASDCYDPMWAMNRYNPRSYRYADACRGYGYGYGYGGSGYNRFGYSPWGYDAYGWNYGRTPVIIVRPSDPDAEPYERGRVIKGRGYTSGSAPSTGRAAPRSSGGSDVSSATRASGGSASVTKPATVRTAKRRGGGEDKQ